MFALGIRRHGKTEFELTPGDFTELKAKFNGLAVTPGLVHKEISFAQIFRLEPESIELRLITPDEKKAKDAEVKRMEEAASHSKKEAADREAKILNDALAREKSERDRILKKINADHEAIRARDTGKAK
jgi:hypothetical protein